ncbi:glycosyltransferase family 4 protein [Sphingomonas echinoides]|uniref:glycosyltransferase family 4 protein n=1 Tax=Sphingomonas echinoides TaxID=59803 RepID=UPI002413C28C|nr:glycosyltransferase family 4 protein [Sphingomonas echinoides]
MNITFVCPELSPAGGVRVIAIFAKNLKKRGHSVSIVHWPKGRRSLPSIVKTLAKKRRLPPPYREGSYFNDSGLTMIPLESRRAVKDSDVPDADLVVATWWETAAPVAALSASKGSKVYFMQDYGAAGQEFPKLVPTWHMPFFFITIAQWLKDAILRENPAASVSVVTNAVDAVKFDAPPRSKQAVPTVGFIHREMHSKGCDIAVSAILAAKTKVPALAVHVVGVDSRPDYLPSFVQYHESVDDAGLSKIYASCDAWIFSSRSEGYGLPITEAMACRTPVIGTRAGAAPELIPGAGILLDTFEPSEMADAIVNIAEMPAEAWQDLSARARESVAGYSWEDATDRFEQALTSAAGRV